MIFFGCFRHDRYLTDIRQIFDMKGETTKMHNPLDAEEFNRSSADAQKWIKRDFN